MATAKLPIAVLDLETDPFLHGRIVKPFLAGFYDGQTIKRFWGADCLQKLADYLLARSRRGERFLIYAHNGGRFDFHFLFPWLDNPIKIINGRIVKAGFLGHYLQDSFSIIPVPLHYGGGKLEIDYNKFERHCRNRYRPEIERYMDGDLIALYEFVERFETDFGRRLTVGSTAMKELCYVHNFRRMTASQDAYFRPYYYGGRVQCLRGGDFTGKFKVYDVRSMYPFVMKNFAHPVNCEFDDADRLPPPSARKTYFAEIEATSYGALPLRSPEGEGIEFPHGRYIFKACGHEIDEGRRLGLLIVHRVLSCKIAQETIRFHKFVDHFYRLKQEKEKEGDVIGVLFCKFMLNSAYGKFGTNIENLYDWLIKTPPGEDPEMRKLRSRMLPGGPWTLYSTCQYFDLLRRPAVHVGNALFDVSIAASITSAARATLLRAIHVAKNPVYCDTDSVICEDLPGYRDNKNLGDWKLELEADRVVIAGKKLYSLAIPQAGGRRWKWIKVRSKGGSLSGADIARIAAGGSLVYRSQAATYSCSLEPTFISRQFKRTAA